MPFIYTPSIFGFAGALIFLVLARVSINDNQWFDAAVWSLLGAAFLLKHLPKFLVLRVLNPVALALLGVGMAMFLVQQLLDVS